MRLLKDGKPLSTAAAQAGMSEPTARKYRRRKKLPSEVSPPRGWHTRVDSFATVWDEVEGLLTLDAGLDAKTVFDELQRRYEGRFAPGQLRTSQWRFRTWRALKGPAREVYFAQQRRPGEQCQSDFTDMNALRDHDRRRGAPDLGRLGSFRGGCGIGIRGFAAFSATQVAGEATQLLLMHWFDTAPGTNLCPKK
jgi:hypothetical protein